MEGVHAHGTLVFEAFLGPVNGDVPGTAPTAIGKDRASTDYHKTGPNAEGVLGLDVASTRHCITWCFTSLQAIEAGRITLSPSPCRHHPCFDVRFDARRFGAFQF